MHFTDLGLAEPLLRAIREQGYDTPTQHGGNGLRLDRGGRVVALLRDGAQERLGQAEVSEMHFDGAGS